MPELLLEIGARGDAGALAARADGAAPPALRRAGRAPSTCRPRAPSRCRPRGGWSCARRSRRGRRTARRRCGGRRSRSRATPPARGPARPRASRRKAASGPTTLQQAPKDPAGGEAYLFHVKKTAGRAAAEVLPGVIAALLRALAFPKRMSWDAWIDDGKGAFPFGRPIRWMVALLDGKVVPFVIDSMEDGARGTPIVESGRGHLRPSLPAARGKAGKAAEGRLVRRPRQGAGQGVRHPRSRGARRADPRAARRPRRRGRGRPPRAGRGVAAPRRVPDDGVRRHPGRVPRLAGRGAGDRARPSSEVRSDASAAARSRASPPSPTPTARRSRASSQGMGRVVVARLRDAAFFFREDLKRPLADRVEDLAGVTFHRELGSYRDKAARLAKLVDGPLAGLARRDGERTAAHEAAQLAKADLTTLMVREFPELQGVMGALYLKAAGAPRRGRDGGALALPPDLRGGGVRAGPRVRRRRVVPRVRRRLRRGQAGHAGRLLRPRARAHGQQRSLRPAPRGAGGDPRAARLLARGDERAPPEPARADRGGAGRLRGPPQEAAAPTSSATWRRSSSTACATSSSPAGSRPTRSRRCWAPASRTPSTIPRKPCSACARCTACAWRPRRTSITSRWPSSGRGTSSPGRLRPPSTAPCWTRRRSGSCTQAVGRLQGIDGGYEARLRSLAGLRGPVDRFFDDVMVMAEDPKVRANRLGLLSQALSLFYRIADISKLGG